MSKWLWASASVRGESHLRTGAKKQDAVRAFAAGVREETFCSVISDGAGSARFGGAGAAITCRIFTQRLRAHFRLNDGLPDEDTIREWIDDIRDTISYFSAAYGVAPRDFACTAVASAATDKGLLAVHIGDGAIVARQVNSSDWELVSAPENGEYASTTYFITDDPEPRVRITVKPQAFQSVVSFTDGIECVALELATMTPHPPFFDAMLRPLQRNEAKGKSQALSASLSSFLTSERLSARTDDDRTIVIASR